MTNFFMRTYGCQMNERDSEKMTGLLTQAGFTRTDSQETADIIIYNTCCVRESAEDKIFGHLSHLKSLKEKQPLIIAVGGCMTQQENIAELIQKKHKYVDIIFGTANRTRLVEFLRRVIENGERVVDISDDGGEFPEISGIPVTTREFPHKAGVNIMYGCDNFCSYCIVPYVRGREKSRPRADIIEEITALAEDGVKEIMLLGQNVNSYTGAQPLSTDDASTNPTVRLEAGAQPLSTDDTSTSPTVRLEAGSASFPELLRSVSEISGIARIRFMTSHPKDFSPALIAAIRDLPKVCKHVHLPLQSGSSRILADMNRHYTKEDYIALAAKLQAEIPNIALSTDIIVGYPGETEEDFADTMDVVRQVQFSGAFTFIYSKRSGTPAAERTDLVERKVSNERFDRLIAELYPIMTRKNEAKIGEILEVMVEDATSGAYKARADDHTLVHFVSDKNFLQGDIVPVKIETAKAFYTTGTHNK